MFRDLHFTWVYYSFNHWININIDLELNMVLWSSLTSYLRHSQPRSLTPACSCLQWSHHILGKPSYSHPSACSPLCLLLDSAWAPESLSAQTSGTTSEVTPVSRLRSLENLGLENDVNAGVQLQGRAHRGQDLTAGLGWALARTPRHLAASYWYSNMVCSSTSISVTLSWGTTGSSISRSTSLVWVWQTSLSTTQELDPLR